MPHPDLLQRHVDTLRANAHHADAHSTGMLISNGQHCLKAIRANAAKPEALGSLGEAVMQAMGALNMALIALHTGRGEPEPVETARTAALAAVDALEAVLKDMEPSNRARILGLG